MHSILFLFFYMLLKLDPFTLRLDGGFSNKAYCKCLFRVKGGDAFYEEPEYILYKLCEYYSISHFIRILPAAIEFRIDGKARFRKASEKYSRSKTPSMPFVPLLPFSFSGLVVGAELARVPCTHERSTLRNNNSFGEKFYQEINNTTESLNYSSKVISFFISFSQSSRHKSSCISSRTCVYLHTA